MPDQSGVEEVLVRAIADALHPEGGMAAGVRCAVYRGWPEAAALGAAMAAGAVHVTVFPGAVRDTTRFMPEWRITGGVPRLGVTVAGASAAFTGVAGEGEVAGLLVDGRAYAYRVRPGERAGLVAAILAAQVRTGRIAILHGARVTVPGAARMAARVVADGGGTVELRRQQQMFRVTAWCPRPEVRDRVCGAIDAALAGMTFLEVDGEACRVRHASGSTSDQGEAAGTYRRDLVYAVEYPTVAGGRLPSMLFGTVGLSGDTHSI